MSNIVDPKALFLGPYSENQQEFRKLTDLLLTDIIQWRRNYHPKEERLIKPADKEKTNWKQTKNELEKELDVLLGDLKQGIPFHNPRFLGHMHSDLVLPALLGYMAGQLYNQNNVVGESSPVTTQKELEFISYLCQMFHYQPLEQLNKKKGVKNTTYSIGHLTSGGTTANIESLWTARNVKYFPLSVRLLLENVKDKDEWRNISEAIQKIKINNKSIGDCKAFELFNLAPEDAYKIHNQIKDVIAPHITGDKKKTKGKLTEKAFTNELNTFTVRMKGVHGIHEEIQKKLGEVLSLPYLILPQSRHYSWEKAMDILGLGSGNIRYVKVDKDFKIDVSDFKSKCKEAKHIIMAVAVVGTTEEGVVDPIAEIVKEKEEWETSGKGFWLHLDAAYGGFYASFFNRDIGKNRIDFHASDELNEIIRLEFTSNQEGIYEEKDKQPQRATELTHNLSEWVNPKVVEDFKALQQADSITIDPHKLGYIPYSAGAILYKDSRCKSFIEKKAPYLNTTESETFDSAKAYLGGNILEGSRSGAAALACYLSSRVIPNHSGGYGKLMGETFKNTRTFLVKMSEANASPCRDLPFQAKVLPLYNSLTNIVCYAVGVRDIDLTADELNELNTRLFDEMSAEKNKLLNDYKFIVSKTELEYAASETNPGYSEQINELLSRLGITPNGNTLKEEHYELTLLRSVLINPLLNEAERNKIFSEYFSYLQQLVNKILPAILLKKYLEKYDDKKDHDGKRKFGDTRKRVLWIENQKRVEKLKNRILIGGNSLNIDISRFLNIDFNDLQGKDKPDLKDYDIFIVDLNLADGHHKEWETGIKVLTDIKRTFAPNDSKPTLIYSQFINEDFKIVNPNGETVDALNGIQHHKTIINFLKHHFKLGDDNFVHKTLDKVVSEKEPVELKDLDLLAQKLAKLIFRKKKAFE